MNAANHLIGSTSPYLLQHAHNPVDWYPWGAQALDRARRGDKPIFLSIGYSACHWCHVMERECFENPDIAAVMNAHFINIKVDREERPDLDDVYMLATQVMTGSGGWPMSVWLTHDLKPFYAGTYFPPEDGHGRPGFPRLLLALADAWKNRRADLLAQAEKIVEAVSHYADEATRDASGGQVQLGAAIAGAVEQQADRFDGDHGGFGRAPKFPPSQALLLWAALLRVNARGSLFNAHGAALVRNMLATTLDHMMHGGIYDHVGGAFARYSVDQFWLVPHFEKMLYDNAQLAPAYALAAAQLDRPDYARIARETLDFWLRDMTSPDGGFYSTLDADSEGHEGKFYVWTTEQIRAALPDPADARLLMEHYGVTDGGNFEGANILFEPAGGGDRALLDPLLLALRTARQRRVPPGLDDKVLTAWNGMMISALAICGRILDEPRYTTAAHRAAEFLMTQHLREGRLFRASRMSDGERKVHIPAFLEDCAMLLAGMLDLMAATDAAGHPHAAAKNWAITLADALVRDFEDTRHGGFFFTGPAHETLFTRLKNATDGATPSANGVAIRSLLRLARATGGDAYRQAAMRAVAAFAGVIKKNPSSFSTILHGLVEDAAFTAPAKIAGGPNPAPAQEHRTEHLELEPAAPISAHPGQTVEAPLRLKVRDGFHIQPETPVAGGLFATVAHLRGDAPIISQQWRFPHAHPIAGDAETLGLDGTLEIIAQFQIAADARPGTYRTRVTVQAQPCGVNACFAPESVSVELALTVREPA